MFFAISTISSAFFKCFNEPIKGTNHRLAHPTSQIHHAHSQLSTAAVQSLASATVHTPGNSQPTICHAICRPFGSSM
ncbi:hypothetical protein GW750_08245 [bacterium]|nr:hypothetical protein [bacterium]